MTEERLKYLKEESMNQRLSFDELVEIQVAFDKIPDEKLSDLKENALVDDMLDEIGYNL